MSEAPTRRPEGGAEEGPPPASPVRQMSLWAPPRSTRHSAARRRRGRVIAIAAAAAVLLGGAGAAAYWGLASGPGEEEAAGAGVSDSFAGSWRGDMSQQDESGAHVTDWGAEVRLESGEERGSSEWYTLNCRGSLTLSERTGDGFVFDYVETYDPDDRCVDSSVLRLSPGAAEGTLEARWEALSHDGTEMVSTGTLR
ncbi:hypothetical protein [Nocardiopsis potens]|uniref:hypothetical protein n=1 Tax=Nocardiopsis potens TaxID=1246458 RepID=UPI00034DF247